MPYELVSSQGPSESVTMMKGKTPRYLTKRETVRHVCWQQPKRDGTTRRSRQFMTVEGVEGLECGGEKYIWKISLTRM